MKHTFCRLTALMLALLWTTFPFAEESTPWGRASLETIKYKPHKVVYDVAASNIDMFEHVLDRVSYLNNIYGADPFDASLVMVLHGDEIPFFAVGNIEKYRELMQRVQSLTIAGPVEYRMCQVAARGHGLEANDIHGFVKLVPMADAEIVRLQQEEDYVYMR